MKIILTPKLEFIIKLSCVLILAGLCFVVYFNGRKLDCNNCSIEFETFKRQSSSSNEQLQYFSVPINQLYNNLLEEHCLVEFDSDQGYFYKQNVTEME